MKMPGKKNNQSLVSISKACATRRWTTAHTP